jgi:hypothetical protein
MNATNTLSSPILRTPAAVLSRSEAIAYTASAPNRYRERDFGIGYGASSGYALDKRYTSDWGASRFRCG